MVGSVDGPHRAAIGHSTNESARQRQDLWLQSWQNASLAKRTRFWASANAELDWSREIAQLPEAERSELLARKQPLVVANLRKSTDPDERLLMALYEAAHQAGGEANPILVAGNPPLTLDTVNTWRRFMEWILDIHLTA
jgi:hypothetical protein